MTIRRKSCDPWDAIAEPWRRHLLVIPDDALQHYVSADTGDTWTEGGILPLDNNYAPTPCSLTYTATDIGNDLDLDVEATGINQFGEKVSEKKTLDVTAGGSTTVYGTVIFARVDEVKVSGLANNAIADTLDIGWSVNANTWYGLPFRINVDSAVGITDKANGSYRDTIKTIFKNGAVDHANTTVSAAKSAVKNSGPYTADATVLVITGEPYADI